MRHLLTLRPQPPYRFEVLLDLLARYDPPALDIAHDGAYWRLLRSGTGLALVRVSVSWPAAPELRADLMAVQGEVDEFGLRAAVARLLPADVDLRPFYTRARQDAALWAVVEPLQGLPELRTATAFEALCQAVIEQQITWRAALRAQRWLAEWGGAWLDYEGRRYYTFPTPQRLAAAQVKDLIPMKITFRRMQLLIDLSAQVARGTLDLDALASESLEVGVRRLTAINGIGPWTAAVALSRAFGHAHYAPNDVALQAAVRRYFGPVEGHSPTEAVTRVFAAWEPFAALAARFTLLCWVLDEYPLR